MHTHDTIYNNNESRWARSNGRVQIVAQMDSSYEASLPQVDTMLNLPIRNLENNKVKHE